MPDHSSGTTTRPLQTKGPLQTTLFGLRVLGDELRRLLLDALRAMEIKRLKRKLDEEYQSLGRQYFEKTQGEASTAPEEGSPGEAVALSKHKVEFLREEIQYLEKSRAELMQDVIKKRIARYDLSA
jgi:hypothetical protein